MDGFGPGDAAFDLTSAALDGGPGSTIDAAGGDTGAAAIDAVLDASAGAEVGPVDAPGTGDASPADALSADHAAARPCPTDCATAATSCQVGYCDEGKGQCATMPRPDGLACDDGNACTQGTICTGGACGGGTPICALPSGLTVTGTSPAPSVGGGTSTFTDTCPAGQVLVGFSGYYTQSLNRSDFFYMTAAQGLCATATPVWDERKAAYVLDLKRQDPLPLRGRTTFGKYERACPAGMVVTGLSGTRYDVAITALQVSCAELQVARAGDAWEVRLGEPVKLTSAVPRSFGDSGFQGPCPAGQIAVGQHGSAPTLIATLGVVCATPSVMLAP